MIPTPTIAIDGKTAWTAKALINYGHGLFIAELKVHSSGMVEMLDDELVMTLTHLKREKSLADDDFLTLSQWHRPYNQSILPHG